MNQWISVEDRLPQAHTPVLVSGVGWARAAISFHHDNHGGRDWSTALDVALQDGELFANGPVTHWTPLPIPIKTY